MADDTRSLTKNEQGVLAAGAAALVVSFLPWFTTVTFDRRGRGRSDVGTEPYAIEREAEDLAAVMAATGARKVVAHSYGGLCALGAIEEGAPIEQLVLYEPPMSVPQPSGEALSSLGAELKEGHHEEAAATFLAAAGATEAELEMIVASRAWPSIVDAVPSLPREISVVGRWTTPQGPFDIPALLTIGGETSDSVYLGGIADLESAFPRLRIEKLEGQRHGQGIRDVG